MFDVVISPSVVIFPSFILHTPSDKIIIPFIDLEFVGMFDIEAIVFFIILTLEIPVGPGPVKWTRSGSSKSIHSLGPKSLHLLLKTGWGDDLDMVSESQGTQKNWNHWKIRPGTKITAITTLFLIFPT